MAARRDAVREAVNAAAPAAPATASDKGGQGARRPPPKPLPPDCPVIPIGTGEGVRYYLNAQRQLVGLPEEQHTRLRIMALFGADADLVHEYWPRLKAVPGRGGETKQIVLGWKPEDAAEQLLRLSAAKGLWNPTDRARGRGCWTDDEGKLIANFGTMISTPQGVRSPGLLGDKVYPAREAIMKPAPLAERDGAAGAAAEILALLETWNWRRPIDARLLLGWLVCAFYGAALAIRPVGWIIGPKNTGKSTLQAALAATCGGWFLSVLDPTPAAIWQTLRHDCLAIGIDEAEAEEDNRRLNNLVKLARLCYSGGRLPRGGADGEASEYMLRSAVLFSSIRQPALLPQDRSRMVVMRLDELPRDQALPDLSAQRLKAHGARLLRRAIDGWPRLAPALMQYRTALKAVGHEGRSVEVFGTLLAAADLVLCDDLPDTDSAAALAGQLPFEGLPEADDDLPDEQVWLGHLLSRVIPLDGVGARQTVRAWLRQAVTGSQNGRLWQDDIDAVRDEADRVLGLYGLKIVRPKEGAPPVHFAIANRGAELERVHAGTPWAGRPGAIGAWKAAARDLAGAFETTQRFASGRGKGTAVPLTLVAPKGFDHDEDDDAASAPSVREEQRAGHEQ